MSDHIHLIIRSDIRSVLLVFFIAVLAACSGTRDLVEDPETGEFRPSDRVSQSRQVQSERLLIDAAKAKMLEDYEEALRLYRQAARVDPNNDAARFELARIFYALDMFEESKREMRNVLRISPNNKWYLIFHAELMAVEENYAEAANAYQRVTELDPDFLEVYYDWAFMLIQQRKYKEAIEVYDRIEVIGGIDETIGVQKYQIYLRMGNQQKAIIELEKLIQNNPGEVRFYGMLGEIYERNENFDQAIKLYERLLEHHPDNPFAILSIANAFLQMENREKYFEYLLIAFENESLDIDAKVGVLVTYVDHLEDSLMKQEAFTLAELVLKQHPENPKSYAVYGDLLYHGGEEEKALEMYKKTLEFDKSVYLVWQQIFFILADNRQFDSLAHYTREAIDYFPNQAIAYYFNGLALIQLEEYEEAVMILSEAIMIAGGNELLKAQIYASLGDAYYHLKQYELMDDAYESSLTIDPQNPYVLNNYSYYLSLRKVNLERAAEMSRLSNDLDDSNSAFQDTYGWIQYQKGNYEVAKKWLEKALEHGGDNRAVILDHYGDVLYQLGDIDNAVKYWQKAKNLGLESDVIGKKIQDRQLYEE